MARTAIETMPRSGPAKNLSDAAVADAVGRCYVFGDAAGLQVGDFKRAWATAVLKAHGHDPQWTKKTKALASDSRVVYQAINLHFNDLRHEGGSRLLEAGWPVHDVQHMLGHTNISTTSTYLNATSHGLHDSMKRFPATDARYNPVARNGETDPSLDGNGEPSDDPQVVVN